VTRAASLREESTRRAALALVVGSGEPAPGRGDPSRSTADATAVGSIIAPMKRRGDDEI
jgi:hypothetical protein